MKKILFAALLFLSSVALAETREIVHMNEILPAIDKDTLVIFDLDNTVMEPVQTLGTDQWFKYFVKKETDAGVDQLTAFQHVVPEFMAVHHVTRMVSTESQTPRLIRYLQSKGTRVMALTARPVGLAQRTIEELASIGVDFSLSPVYAKNTLIGGLKYEAYIRGVALISPIGDKGTALVTFLKQIGLAPKNIVFVDDTPKNVVSVETALANYPFKHTGFRYGFDDRKVAAFNPRISEIEWKYFVEKHILLNDQQASQIQPR